MTDRSGKLLSSRARRAVPAGLRSLPTLPMALMCWWSDEMNNEPRTWSPRLKAAAGARRSGSPRLAMVASFGQAGTGPCTAAAEQLSNSQRNARRWCRLGLKAIHGQGPGSLS
jgi:hypothetical protein